VLLATRDSAVKSKRAAITLMKGLLVSAAPSLREGLRSLADPRALDRGARLRIGPTQTSEQRATIIAIAPVPDEPSPSEKKPYSSTRDRADR